MDHLFNAFVSRKTSRRYSSCGDKPVSNPAYVSRKSGTLKRASSGSGHSDFTKNMNSELLYIVDEQLMQIRENLAKFREQDTQLRERMSSLSDSVSELASRSSLSSFTPSECSNLSSLDELQSCGEDEGEENVFRETVEWQLTTYIKSNNQPPVECCHMKRTTSDPSSMCNHVELPEEEEMETQRHSTYSADQAINLYPQYTHPENISTLF